MARRDILRLAAGVTLDALMRRVLIGRLGERKAEHSKPTPEGAHPVAAEPGTPVRFTLP
jgi:hypothetical protein